MLAQTFAYGFILAAVMGACFVAAAFGCVMAVRAYLQDRRDDREMDAWIASQARQRKAS